jgi:hypothetical protein
MERGNGTDYDFTLARKSQPALDERQPNFIPVKDIVELSSFTLRDVRMAPLRPTPSSDGATGSLKIKAFCI